MSQLPIPQQLQDSGFHPVSHYLRRLRIAAIHARNDFREHNEAYKFLRQNLTPFRSFVLGAVTALVVPRSVTFMRHCWVNAKIMRLLSRPHRRAGEATPCDQVLSRHGFCLGYSYNYRSPVWCSYFVCNAAVVGTTSKQTSRKEQSTQQVQQRNATASLPERRHARFDFRADSEIPREFRNTAEHFANNSRGFERGHLAPVATLSFSQHAQFDSSLLSSVVFQHPSVNRGAWHRLERLTRLWASRTPKSVLAVVCGPLFLHNGGTPRINGIAVPSAFFLAVLHTRTGKCIAFVVPNNETGGKRPLQERILAVNALERNYNLKIFRSLPFWHRPLPWQSRRVDHAFWRGEPAAIGVATTKSVDTKEASTKSKVKAMHHAMHHRKLMRLRRRKRQRAGFVMRLLFAGWDKLCSRFSSKSNAKCCPHHQHHTKQVRLLEASSGGGGL